MSARPFVLDNSLGAMFIGVVVATSLHGISVLQAWNYYTHQDDKWFLKSMVAAVMTCDTVHQALITHTVYTYVVTNWGNPAALKILVRSLVISGLFNGLTVLLVQSFLTVRLWKLSNHNIILTTVTSFIVLAEFVTSLVLTVLGLQRETFHQLAPLKSLSLTINALTAFGDVLIAGALCFLLHRSRTGFQRSDSMINKLILFTVNTGLITSLYALAAFIAYMAYPTTFIYVAFYFCLGRLYTNTFLATLNAREMMMRDGSDTQVNTTDKVTLSLRELSKSGTTSRQRGGPNISIKINTTKEFVTDLMHDQEQDDEKNKIATSRSNDAFFEANNSNV